MYRFPHNFPAVTTAPAAVTWPLNLRPPSQSGLAEPELMGEDIVGVRPQASGIKMASLVLTQVFLLVTTGPIGGEFDEG